MEARNFDDEIKEFADVIEVLKLAKKENEILLRKIRREQREALNSKEPSVTKTTTFFKKTDFLVSRFLQAVG